MAEILNSSEVKAIFDYYKLTEEEKYLYSQIAKPIIENYEFQKRLSKEFKHHGDETLGMHIITDSILAYKLTRGILARRSDAKLSPEDTLIMSLFHDLYTFPWQNAVKKSKVIDRHWYVHPIEAALNSMEWFPEYFCCESEEKYVDGIVHHMYPVPVRKIDGENIELNNAYLLANERYFELLKNSTRSFLDGVSLRPANSEEGRILCYADKLAAFHEVKDVRSAIICFTGKNDSSVSKK